MAGNKSFVQPNDLPRIEQYAPRDDELMLIRNGRISRGPVIQGGGGPIPESNGLSEDFTLEIPADFPVEPGNPVLLDDRGRASFELNSRSNARPVAGIMLSKDLVTRTCIVRHRGLVRLRTGISGFRFATNTGLLPVWSDWRYPGWLAWRLDGNVARANGVQDFSFANRGLRYLGTLLASEDEEDAIITVSLDTGQEDPRAINPGLSHGVAVTQLIAFPRRIGAAAVNRLVEAL